MKIFRETASAMRNRSWPEGVALGFLSRVGIGAAFHARARIVSRAGTTFENRAKGSRQLLVILAGYKPNLWEYTLARIARFQPKDLDVCLLSCGRRLKEFETLAQEQGWSYLSTELNEVSVAQNAVIERHPRAELIYKLDEDMFIGESFFELMLEGHRKVQERGLFRLGFSAPLINVNGYSYAPFLRALGLERAYEDKFGAVMQAGDKIAVVDDPKAAEWIWEQSLPFDAKVRDFSSRGFDYTVCPHRFSIGAMLFERTFWDSMGGWPVNNVPGGLGFDEAGVCRHCMVTSQVIAVLHKVFVGHFAFGPQTSGMTAALPRLRDGLLLRADRTSGAAAIPNEALST